MDMCCFCITLTTSQGRTSLEMGGVSTADRHLNSSRIDTPVFSLWGTTDLILSASCRPSPLCFQNAASSPTALRLLSLLSPACCLCSEPCPVRASSPAYPLMLLDSLSIQRPHPHEPWFTLLGLEHGFHTKIYPKQSTRWPRPDVTSLSHLGFSTSQGEILLVSLVSTHSPSPSLVGLPL